MARPKTTKRRAKPKAKPEQLTTPEVIDLLRRRYPARDQLGNGAGPWTTTVEYAGIDFLAFAAWSKPPPAQRAGNSYPIIGHELKVSRGDYRRELRKPDKRARNVARCTEFYFVTPKGLLTDEEKAYEEPEHFADGAAFVREECPRARYRKRQRRARGQVQIEVEEPLCRKPSNFDKGASGQPHTNHGDAVAVETVVGGTACLMPSRWGWMGRRHLSLIGHMLEARDGFDFDGFDDLPAIVRRELIGDYKRWQVCELCGGLGYLRKSTIEVEAPTLWIPRDVGLIEVSSRGCSVVRKAPVNDAPKGDWGLGQLVRWMSRRPDPRHHERPEVAENGAEG